MPANEYLPISLLNPWGKSQQNSTDSGMARLAHTRTIQKDHEELL